MPSLMRLADPFLRERLTILIYHRVRQQPDALFPDEVHAARFCEQVDVLRKHFSPMPVTEALERLSDGSLPPRAVCITFDDGYADNFHVAAPILKRAGISAAFFIATDFVDGGRMWNDSLIEAVRRAPGAGLQVPSGIEYDVSSLDARRRTAEALVMAAKYLPADDRAAFVAGVVRAADAKLPIDLMMTSDELRGLCNSGMEIGAHTCSHPILTALSNAAAAAEFQQSRARLESIIAAPVKLFAYPNGKPSVDYVAEHAALVRRLGFRAAFSTASGYALPSSDQMQLPRFTPWDRSPSRFAARLLGNFFRAQTAFA